MSPKVLREVILENFEKLNEPETSTSDKPESVSSGGTSLKTLVGNFFPTD